MNAILDGRTIKRIQAGSIDMHVHHGPDYKLERRVDALQAARQAQEADMRAIVLKNHTYPTAPLAYIVNQLVEGVTVLGSIALDYEVGGLNPHALEASAKLGAKVVWMPTHNSANDLRKHGVREGGITVLDANQRLLPVVSDILDVVKSYRMVLATGHLSFPEALAVVDEARKKGISKLVISHPLLEDVGACLDLKQQGLMAEKGTYLEQCFGMTMPLMGRVDPARIVESVRAVGAARCILSTDLGQAINPSAAEGMAACIGTMLQLGLSEEEIELMVKVNPAKLLDLD